MGHDDIPSESIVAMMWAPPAISVLRAGLPIILEKSSGYLHNFIDFLAAEAYPDNWGPPAAPDAIASVPL